MPKKKWIPLWILAMAIAFTAGAYANDGFEKVDAFLRPDFKLELDGKPAEFGEIPLLYEGRTYLSVRAIGELLGADVGWRQSDFTVVIKSPAPIAVEDSDRDSSRNSGSTGRTRLVYQKDPIRFEKVQNYVMEVPVDDDDEDPLEFHVLTNQYEGAIYLRLSDLSRLKLDRDQLRVWEEEETKQLFVLASDLSSRVETMPRFTKILDGPVITGTTDEDKIEALERSHRTAHYVRPVDGKPGYYEVLTSGADKFYLRIVELEERKGSLSGWLSRFRERIELYKDDDDKKK